MSESTQITEPTETIVTPAPSWAPVFFAVGILGLIASLYAADFMFPQEWYGWVGIVFVVGALISFGRKGRRAYYRLPREQGDVRAELPVASIATPPRAE